MSNCLLDVIFYDTFFVISYFHYILSLGAVYSIFATIYMYFHHIFSFGFTEFIARSFITLFIISSNILFFPMHSIGILGHSRRIFDYPILFSHHHHLSSIGISGILLAIISSSFSLLILYKAFIDWFYLLYVWPDLSWALIIFSLVCSGLHWFICLSFRNWLSIELWLSVFIILLISFVGLIIQS